MRKYAGPLMWGLIAVIFGMTIASSEAESSNRYRARTRREQNLHEDWTSQYNANGNGFHESFNRTLPQPPQNNPTLDFFSKYATYANIMAGTNLLSGMATCGYGYFVPNADEYKNQCHKSFVTNLLTASTLVAQTVQTSAPNGAELDNSGQKVCEAKLQHCLNEKQSYYGAARITFQQRDKLNGTLNECLEGRIVLEDHLVQCEDELQETQHKCVQRCNEDNKVVNEQLANMRTKNNELRKKLDYYESLDKLAMLIPFAEGWFALAVQIMLVIVVIVWLALARGLQALVGAARDGLLIRTFLAVTICPCLLLFAINNPFRLFSEDQTVRTAFWSECVTQIMRNFGAVFVLFIYSLCSYVVLQMIVAPIITSARQWVTRNSGRRHNVQNEVRERHEPVVREYRQLLPQLRQQQVQEVPRMSTLVPRQRQVPAEEQNFFAQRIVRMDRMEPVDY